MFKVSTTAPGYRQTLRRYMRARGKTHREVVERWAQQANLRMASSESRGGVRRAKLSMHPMGASADPEKGGKTYKGRFYYAEQASLGVKKGAGGNIVMRPAAKRSWAKRRSARGAMAAGFLTSGRKHGLRKRGTKATRARAGGSAARSTGQMRGRGRKPHAISINAVAGSYEVGRRTMARAIDHVVRDADDFARKLLQKTNDRAMAGTL